MVTTNIGEYPTSHVLLVLYVEVCRPATPRLLGPTIGVEVQVTNRVRMTQLCPVRVI